MSDFLDQVVAERRADVARAKGEVRESALHERARRRGISMSDRHAPRDRFADALREPRIRGKLAVIAELKRVSPALGVISTNADFRAIARRYEEAGAAAISVLCEPRHWGGSIDDLASVRQVVDIPLLCKDVIVDEYQIVEAWAAGADAVLLIAEALDDAQLRHLIARASVYGLDVLVEGHETAAFERAVGTGAMVVGVNARDLRAPKEIRPERIRLLHHLARAEQVLVAESGIETVEDARVLPGRVDAVLVGTALMRSSDPGVLIRQLSGVTRGGPAGAATEAGPRADAERAGLARARSEKVRH